MPIELTTSQSTYSNQWPCVVYSSTSELLWKRVLLSVCQLSDANTRNYERMDEQKQTKTSGGADEGIQWTIAVYSRNDLWKT